MLHRWFGFCFPEHLLKKNKHQQNNLTFFQRFIKHTLILIWSTFFLNMWMLKRRWNDLKPCVHSCHFLPPTAARSHASTVSFYSREISAVNGAEFSLSWKQQRSISQWEDGVSGRKKREKNPHDDTRWFIYVGNVKIDVCKKHHKTNINSVCCFNQRKHVSGGRRAVCASFAWAACLIHC